MIPRDTVFLILRTLAIAFAGGFLANLVGLSAGWLSGSMIAVTVCAIGRLPVHVPPRVADAVFIVLGALLGAGITPEIVSRIGAWPLSLASLLISVLAMVVAVQVYLVRVAGWDRSTAFYASLPGALSYVVALAAASGADLRRVVVGQSIRLFLLVVAIPALVSSLEPIVPPTPPPLMAPIPLVLLLAASTAGALVFAALRVPAAYLTGALLVSGVAHAAGIVSGTLPPALTVVAYITLGAMIGGRFVGTDLAFLRRIAAASIGAFLVATAIAALCAFAVAAVVDVPLVQILVAFAPGGLDTMTALALALHMDSAFVAAHQLARFVGIAVVAPFVARRMPT
ncbi:MAG: AbrB family transcriptional regulator [Bauldia sp.]